VKTREQRQPSGATSGASPRRLPILTQIARHPRAYRQMVGSHSYANARGLRALKRRIGGLSESICFSKHIPSTSEGWD